MICWSFRIFFIVFTAVVRGRANPQNGQFYGGNNNNIQGFSGGGNNLGNIVNTGNVGTSSGGNDGSGGGSLELSIPGVPGQDYPVLQSVPNTGFTCVGQIPGYYADTAPEAGCQVFHICEQGSRMHSFLCPVGTLFNQQYFVCDWWYNFPCSSANQFYNLNSLIGQTNVGISGNTVNTGGNFVSNSANTGNINSNNGGTGNYGSNSG